MRKKKSWRITVETDRVLIIPSPPSLVAWCATCGRQATMITVDEAAVLAGVSARTIFRGVEAGRLHCAETSAGLLFICLNSLGQIHHPGNSAEGTNDQR